MRTVFKRPDYRLFFIGSAASLVGDSLMLLVLAIWVKDLTGSDGAAGFTMFCLAAPVLLAPLAGWLVDRVMHRPFLIVANVVNALFLLPLVFVRDESDVWIIYLVAFLLGIGSIADGPAVNGLLKNLLPADLLVEANSATQTVKQGVRLVGPLIGAGLFAAAGGFTVAVVDAASFLVAAIAIAALKVRQDKPERSELRWLAELSAGFRYLAGDAVLRRALTGLCLGATALGAVESVGFALNDKGLHQPPEFISVIVTAMGIGGLAGGLIATWVIRRIGELAAEGLALLLIALTFAVWIVPTIPSVLLAAPVVGLSLPILFVADNTLIQRRSPNRLIGRVSSASDLLFTVPNLASLAAGALLVSLVDYRLMFAVMAAIMAAAGFYLYLGRRLTSPEQMAATQVGRND